MEHLSKRAFTVGFVVFTFVLLVSSATDDSSHTGQSGAPAAVSKVEGETPEADKTDNHSKKNGTTPKKPETASESVQSKNCSANGNDTECADDGSFMSKFWDHMVDNRDMLFRTLYVLLGVTGIVIIYFVVRAVRLRRKRNKSRKYGVITTRGDLEMEPLGQGDDEDEDYTVFEMNGRSK